MRRTVGPHPFGRTQVWLHHGDHPGEAGAPRVARRKARRDLDRIELALGSRRNQGPMRWTPNEGTRFFWPGSLWHACHLRGNLPRDSDSLRVTLETDFMACRSFATAGLIAFLALPPTAYASADSDSISAPKRWSSFLPLLSELATSRGIELPLPLGVGLVYYHLDRDILISDVRVGRNGAPPQSVSDFATLSATSNVENVNLKLDAWILPFVNIYAILGYVFNDSQTRLDVTLPPLIPSNPARQFRMDVPTSI